MKSKIGILGGTFNPIHNGHIALALAACRQFELDRVLIMVSPAPPHKANKNIAHIQHRVNMIKLAIEPYRELEFSDFELDRTGYVYTADTLTLLKEQHPENKYFFIMGGDSIRDIEKWYKPEIVMKYAVLLAAVRDEMDISSIDRQTEHLKSKYGADIRLLSTENMPISSSAVRDCIKDGKSIDGMVSEKVKEYINLNHIYHMNTEGRM